MGIFFTSSSRSFRTSDSPDEARRIVDSMTVEDGAPHGLPPFVVAGRTGRGSFAAASPVAAFDSRFEVASDGRGGSIVTERKTAGSFIPGASMIADAIHDAATSPRDAYYAARRRR